MAVDIHFPLGSAGSRERVADRMRANGNQGIKAIPKPPREHTPLSDGERFEGL